MKSRVIARIEGMSSLILVWRVVISVLQSEMTVWTALMSSEGKIRSVFRTWSKMDSKSSEGC